MVGENKSVLAIILFRTRFDCMAIGGMAALMHREILMYNSVVNRFSQYLLKNAAGFLMFFLFLMMVFLSWKFDLSLYPLYSVLFACLIYRWINQPPKILTIPILIWLGKISYAIYLLHHFAVYIAFGALFNYMGSSEWSELYYFAGASVITIILASISYYGIERRFLRMKQKPIGNFQIETD
jgi:peptidoglycan/LPS O-acetylase OafA/YrhL